MSKFRPDLSTKLVHLVKGDTMEAAFDVLSKILDDRKFKGGRGMIRGGHTCVCFTESPLAQLVLSLSSRDVQKFKYRALGLMVDKTWAFGHGARPAIYGPAADYDALPQKFKHRFVRYELGGTPETNVDFTWEREWRLEAEELAFTPEDVTVVVPARAWADELIETHANAVRERVRSSGASAVERYPWHIVALSDLGIDVPDELAPAPEPPEAVDNASGPAGMTNTK